MENFARCCGYAVYAVANADKKIETREKEELQRILNKEWNVFVDGTDQFGVKAIDFVQEMMIELETEQLQVEVSLNRFSAIYSEIKAHLTEQQKRFILDLCINVGGAFNRMNKSELVVLSRIEQIIRA